MTFIVLSVIQFVLLVIVGRIAYAQYIQNKRYEEIVDVFSNNFQSLYEIIVSVSDKLDNEHLRRAFEADDEVGDFFKEILSIQEILQKFVK